MKVIRGLEQIIAQFAWTKTKFVLTILSRHPREVESDFDLIVFAIGVPLHFLFDVHCLRRRTFAVSLDFDAYVFKQDSLTKV